MTALADIRAATAALALADIRPAARLSNPRIATPGSFVRMCPVCEAPMVATARGGLACTDPGCIAAGRRAGRKSA